MTNSAPSQISARPRPQKSGGAYGVIHRLHSVAGVFVAPLLVISALSGFLYAFAPSLENIVYRDVITASSEMPAQPLAEQSTRA